MMVAIKTQCGADRYARAAAAQRVRAAARPRAAAGRAAAARRRPLRQLPRGRLSPRARLLRRPVLRGLAPRVTNTQISNVWDEFAAAGSSSTSPAPGTSASSSAACRPSVQDDWMTAPLPGPERPRRLDRRRLQPRRLLRLAAPGGGLEADRVPVAARTCSAASTQLTGDLPPRRSSWERPPPGRRRARGRLPRSARARRAHPEGAGVGAHRHRAATSSASRRRTASVSVDEAAAELDARADRILEKRRWMLEQEARPRERVARRLDVRRPCPAGHLGLFFFLPVLAALRAQPDRLRPLRAGRPGQPALRRRAQLPAPCCRRRCSGRRWATRSTSSSSACRCRSALSLGAALLLHAGGRAPQGRLPHRAVRAGGHHRWSPSR